MPSPLIDSRTHRALSGVSRVAVLEVIRSSAAPLDVQAIAGRVGLHPNTVRSHLDRLLEVGLVSEAVEDRARPGRPRLLYEATAPVESDPADSYRLLAGILAGGLESGAPLGRDADADTSDSGARVAVAAGQRWAEQLVPTSSGPAPIDAAAAIGRIVEILDDVGFAPRLCADTPAADTLAADTLAADTLAADTLAADTLAADTPAADTPAADTRIELHNCPFLDVARDHSAVVCSVHRGLMQGALERMHAPAFGVTLEPFARPGVCIAHLLTQPRQRMETAR